MPGWLVQGVELPFGDAEREWWVDGFGQVADRPVQDAEVLPGRYVLRGLVDMHAHPAIGERDGQPVACSSGEALRALASWAEEGVVLVRDVGSPAGVTLDLRPAGGVPKVIAAGRFLAPANRYFPELLVDPVSEEELIDAALGEVRRGARWVKLIADFPDMTDHGEPEPTYPMELIGRMVDAVHASGARVAAHCTLPNAGELIAAGVDSIEHGLGLDEDSVRMMARAGAGWTPTLCALFGSSAGEDVPRERRARFEAAREAIPPLLRLAVDLGVMLLAGTDVVGNLPREIAILADAGLEPAQALAAASEWPRAFLGEQGEPAADFVTYSNDPREDLDELRRPAAVIVGGVRVR
jgi:imidazolonepropionase-like amidohydrolase